jgi:hypothetical protein
MAREWSPTKEPVTVSGWYEHVDGTWSLFTWRDGQLVHDATAASAAEIPSREERWSDRGFERVFVDTSTYPDDGHDHDRAVCDCCDCANWRHAIASHA